MALKSNPERLAVASLGLSALALALAPLLMPGSYTWIAHTTSESAAQGIPGAWLARSGFVVFSVAVVTIALRARGHWERWGVALHVAFGALMAAAAAFSARPWDPQLPYSQFEDLLHSIAATAMGFAFAIGVTVIAFHRWKHHRQWRAIDVVAVTASIVLPLAMTGAGNLAGVFQRLMFLIAYLWYGIEAARLKR